MFMLEFSINHKPYPRRAYANRTIGDCFSARQHTRRLRYNAIARPSVRL